MSSLTNWIWKRWALPAWWLTGRLMPDFKTIADFRRDNGSAIRATCAQFIVLSRARRRTRFEKCVGPFINKLCQERNRYFTRFELPTAGNKELKARSIQARLQKRVWFPHNAPWLAAFESELLQFPAGAHDDQVDALANIGRILDRMSAGQVPKAQVPQRWPMKARPNNRNQLDFGLIDKDLNIGSGR